MKTLSLIQVALGLRNLLDERRQDLFKTRSGKFREPALVELRTAIDSLPAALTEGLPQSEELKQVDALHDGYGGVLFYTIEAFLRWPEASAEMLAAANRVRDAFVPALTELQDSYALETHRAAERRPLLKTLKADLSLFPAPAGGTLYDVATKFLDAGDQLDALLDRRASVPKPDRSRAGTLRAKALGALSRLREDVRDEVAQTPGLPRDIEHRIFGYFDTLRSMSKKSAQTNGPKDASPPTTPDPAKVG